jgi:two-component system osmolarity sensor histidine kinase EnvZ
MMPKGLYTRSLIIVIAPVILLQSVLAFVFMERHWQLVTRRLSAAVVRDIAAIIDLTKRFPATPTYPRSPHLAAEAGLEGRPSAARTAAGARPKTVLLDSGRHPVQPDRQPDQAPFWIDTVGASNIIEIRIQLDDSILRVFARRNQAYASNTHIFLIWMVGTSLVLLTIAILFLRNQIRPILQLAEAAESFGKGRPMPERLSSRAARIRGAARRPCLHPDARAHRAPDRPAHGDADRRQPRPAHHPDPLQAATGAGGPQDGHAAMNQDVDDMQSMLEGYLSFARGEAAEDPGSLDMDALLDRFREEAVLRSKQLKIAFVGEPTVHVRPHAFTRLLSNLVGNAFRYANSVSITATHRKGIAERHRRRRRTGHSRRTARRRVQAVSAAGRGAQSGRQRHRARPVHRPRHRPQPWRRHHAGRQPAWRPARHRAVASLTRVASCRSEQPPAVRHLEVDRAEHNAPSSSGKPSVRTSDMNLPIWRGGKFTTAKTCRPTSVSGA